MLFHTKHRRRSRSLKAYRRTWDRERKIRVITPQVIMIFWFLVANLPVKRHPAPFAKTKRGYLRRQERLFAVKNSVDSGVRP